MKAKGVNLKLCPGQRGIGPNRFAPQAQNQFAGDSPTITQYLPTWLRIQPHRPNWEKPFLPKMALSLLPSATAMAAMS